MTENKTKLRKIVSDAVGTNENNKQEPDKRSPWLLWLGFGLILAFSGASYFKNSNDNAPYLIEWGLLNGSTRDFYREDVFAYFPWALGPVKPGGWTIAQDWLSTQHSIANSNIRDIIRSRRNGDMPRQVATFLYSYEGALTKVSIETSAHLTATWRQHASADREERIETWKQIILDSVRKAHGQKWADVVKVTLNQ